MEKKKCSRCKEYFPATIEYFYRNSGAVDGLGNMCQVCQKASTREWQQKNKDRYREYQREYQKKKNNRANEYALYKGDEIIGIGTAKELAELTGVRVSTIYSYKTKSYKNRTSDKNGRRLVKL